MKGKRIMLVVVLLVLLLVGWYISIKKASGVEIIEQQNELEAQADVLAEKELYVRAIPLYEEALTYTTDSNKEIEDKLLSCYLAFGQTSDYISIIEKRAAANTATEAEYEQAAQLYLDSGDLDEAMTLLKLGMAQLGSSALERMYEDNRYGYTIRRSLYEEIVPTYDNSIMPTYNGEKWGYVNNKNKLVIDFIYDEATPFNSSGYAAVKYEGKYYIITSSGVKYGVDETGITDVYMLTDSYVLAQANGYYSYYNYDFECVASGHQYEEITANACGVAAVKKNGKWGIITDSGATVVDFVLDDVAVNSLGAVYADNRAMVKMDGLWYLIDTEGNKISETGFVDAKAPESDGYIAVADENAKWGFIDGAGNLIIDYQYLAACSFSQHLAAVQIGAYWGYISEKNELVIDQLLNDAMPFHNGIAQARFEDGEGLFTLEYLED